MSITIIVDRSELSNPKKKNPTLKDVDCDLFDNFLLESEDIVLLSDKEGFTVLKGSTEDEY